MANKYYTLMLIPERSAAVRRIQLSKTAFYAGALLTLAVMACTAAAAVHYGYVVEQVFENRRLRSENQRLRDRLGGVDKRIGGVEQSLAVVQKMDQKLRSITRLADPRFGMALGPLDGVAPGGQGPAGGSEAELALLGALPADTVEEQDLALGILESRLDGLPEEATRQTASLRQLLGYYHGRDVLLRSTPSVVPTHGWVTSEFGMRDDPYTAERTMHAGLDIAGREGAPVLAPADGVVTFTGIKGGYGNMVVVE